MFPRTNWKSLLQLEDSLGFCGIINMVILYLGMDTNIKQDGFGIIVLSLAIHYKYLRGKNINGSQGRY